MGTVLGFENTNSSWNIAYKYVFEIPAGCE